MRKDTYGLSGGRRNFLKNVSLGALGIALASGASACSARSDRKAKKQV
jgi:hypothetical protein